MRTQTCCGVLSQMFFPSRARLSSWHPAIARYGHLGSVPTGDTKALTRVIEERTRPLHGGLPTGFTARFDTVFSELMAIALPSRIQV